MRPEALVVASQNPDKITEVEAVVRSVAKDVRILRGYTWPEVDETEPTLRGNAILKAQAVARITGQAALADDTGLEVAALDGAPGVHTARFSGPNATYEENVDLLLQRLDGVRDRRATFRTVVALVDPDGRRVVAEGELRGAIALERSGSGGFGYDPVFDVDGRTLSEIGADEKNRISHRAMALHNLARLVWARGPAIRGSVAEK